MPKIEIYSKNPCPYCVKAKDLFDSKNVKYQSYDIESDFSKLKEMSVRTNNARTVPQIFINDQLIGGYDDLKKLDDEGKLDVFLGEK